MPNLFPLFYMSYSIPLKISSCVFKVVLFFRNAFLEKLLHVLFCLYGLRIGNTVSIYLLYLLMYKHRKVYTAWHM